MEDRQNSLPDEKDHSPKNNSDEEIRNPNLCATENDTLPVSSQPVFNSGTYVVQVPKDQIYRVPPPENALMLEQRTRNQDKQKKRSCCCFCSCHSCLFNLFRGNKSG